MKLKRGIFVVLGCVGIALPVLPTVPFFLATVFFFANSSLRLHNWFLATDLYRKHLELFVQKRGMLVKTKLAVLASVTILMAIGFILMARKELWVPCVLLAVVWVAHVIYFLFGVRTLKPEDN